MEEREFVVFNHILLLIHKFVEFGISTNFFSHVDSGSMNTPLGKKLTPEAGDEYLVKLGDITVPFERSPTRWDELRQTVSIVVDIASV